jgi:hypothetical protein
LKKYFGQIIQLTILKKYYQNLIQPKETLDQFNE